ncbi:MAG: tryptophanase [Elusimicrobiales bacterium]
MYIHLEDWKWKTVIEPHRIKTVEPLGFTSRRERGEILARAHYNLFNIPAEKVLLDFLTDSGTGAMSAAQWSAIMSGDESYAGASSYYRFEAAVRGLTGFGEVIPAHQGRAAERILFSFVGGKGKTVVSNSHFDTTRANVEAGGAEAVDLPVKEALDFARPGDFKGNMDTAALEKFIKERGAQNIALCVMTVTNNSLGGQPVSLANLKRTYEICSAAKIPVFLDMARFAENAYFIKLREKGCENRSAEDIAKEMFRYADGCMMSAKKDALVNIGGFMAMKNKEWAARARQVLILGEGFPTYGGLAGRDLDAMAVGLGEVLDEKYLAYRIRSAQYLGDGLRKAGVPIVEPPGGHAVYVDARRFLPHIPPEKFPAQSLACALYLEGGIRTVEIGMLMFGNRDAKGNFTPASMELVRIALPRRVYTQSHIDLLIEVFEELAKRKTGIRGLEIEEAPAVLAHFTAKLRPAEKELILS